MEELEVDAKTQRVIEAIEAILKRMEVLGGDNDPDEQRAIYDDLFSVHEYLKYGIGDLS